MRLYQDGETKIFYEKTEEGVVITKVETDAKKIVLPAEIDGMTVVAVMTNAFEPCENLEDVSFPDEITAFDDEEDLDDEEDEDEEDNMEREFGPNSFNPEREAFLAGPGKTSEEADQSLCKLIRAAYAGVEPEDVDDDFESAFLLRDMLDLTVEEFDDDDLFPRLHEFMDLDFFKSLPNEGEDDDLFDDEEEEDEEE